MPKIMDDVDLVFILFVLGRKFKVNELLEFLNFRTYRLRDAHFGKGIITKNPNLSTRVFLVAGTGLEPVSVS